MTERDDIDMLAAEYVLGTLDAQEREDVVSRRLHEADLDAAIGAWEQRLGPLNATVPNAVPSPDLFAKIAAKLPSDTATPLAKPASANVVEVARWRAAAHRWRAAAVAAVATAATLAAVIIYQPGLITSGEQRYVAVFNHGDKQPAFVLSIDLATRQLTIRPVTADPPTGKSYELWIVSNELGPAPKSLGLLGPGTSLTRKTLADFDADLLQSATFGISLEPEGGSPIGKPTGPALHGKLIPAAE